MRTGEIEANLVTLNEEFRLPYIADLVARKVDGPEKSKLEDADIAFHEPVGDKPLPPPPRRGTGRAVQLPSLGGVGSGFMVPQRAQMRKKALHKPAEFRARAPIESGGGPPHSKTLARWPQPLELPPGFGVRRPCGALDFPGRFMVPMHGTMPWGRP
jgi:hypothetical protein